MQRASIVMVALALAVLALAVCACGGAVERDDDPDSPPSQGSGSGGPSGDGAATEGGSSKIPLGPCREGFEPFSIEEPCNWLADGLCYATKEEACACACPDMGDSTCISGFYKGEGLQTRVSCS